MANIAYAKLGKSIKFIESKFSPTGGDNEAIALLKAIANNNPDNNYYIVGKSNFKKLNPQQKEVLFPHNNVFDVWEDSNVKSPDTKQAQNIDNEYYKVIENYLDEKNTKIDYCIYMIGSLPSSTIPEVINSIRDPSKKCKISVMAANYSAPITIWNNKNKDIPVITLIPDPRYHLGKPRDLLWTPKFTLSQYDFDYTLRYIKSYDDQQPIEVDGKGTYDGIEKMFLVGKKFPKNASNIRNRKFTIILNEGKPSRYKKLKEWIFDNEELSNCEVYGKWSEDITENDDRFKGSIHLDDVATIMNDTRYTFIIPIAKGWVTSKYIEMIYHGCIPFFHPEYDEQRHINIPEILRPRNKDELNKAIETFESDEELRIKTIKHLQETLIDKDDLNGKKLADTIKKYENQL